MKKFALISASLPPAQSAQSMVIYHLLKKRDPRKYCLLTPKNIHLYSIKPKCLPQLAANYYFLNPDYQFVRILVHLASTIHTQSLLDFLVRIRSHQIKKIICKEKCEKIIVCTGDLLDPPAALTASRELNLPFVFYAFDYYSHAIDPLLRAFSTRYEAELVKSAAGVIVPNEYLYDEYLTRYGVKAIVLHNPFDIKEYEKNAATEEISRATEPMGKTIVYTGAIYDAHYDAFRNLIAAVTFLKMKDIKIHLYTPQSHYHLIGNNITGPQVIVFKALPALLMPGIQRTADILFLPLAFGSGYPDIIRTSAPGKMGEYLASGTPILVHAPKDSFVSWFFKEYNCGLVVDENSPEVLAQAVTRLLTDKELCKELTKNAYHIAQSEFDIRILQNKLYDLIDE